MCRKRIGRIAALTPTVGMLALTLVAAPAVAQRTFFDPTVIATSYYTNSADLACESVSDGFYRVALDLPVRREMPRGSLLFGLTPYIERYRSAEVYDHEGLRARALWNRQPTERSSVDLSGSFRRTQDQGGLEALEDEDLFLPQRLERDVGNLRLGYGRRVSERWSWNVATAFSRLRFRQVVDDPGEEPPADRSTLSAEVGADRTLSAHSSVGFRLARHDFEIDDGGDETVDLVSFSAAHRLSTHWRSSLLLGAYFRSGRTPDGVRFSNSGPQGTLILVRDLRRTSFRVLVGNRFSSGGALPGTAEHRNLELSLASRDTRRWSWSVFTRFTRRLPSQPDQAEADLAQAGGSIDLSLERTLGLRFGGFYSDYDGEGLRQESFYRIEAGLVWHPIGRTGLAGGIG